MRYAGYLRNPIFDPMLRTALHPVKPRARRNYGFSLVELMVVVMVILVIAAIAVPSFVQARMKANEASAVSSMHAIETAQILYEQSYPEMGFAKHLIDLGSQGGDCKSPDPTHACLILDENLTSGFKSGYMFDLVSDGQTPSLSYTLNAMPQVAGVSGGCSFSTQGGEVMVSSAAGGGSVSRLSMGNSSGCGR